MTVVDIVRAFDGVARTRELLDRGLTKHEVASAVRRGQVIRLRVGWLGLPALPDEVVRAHRVGGRPACATVAQMNGLWMLNEPALHVEVAQGESRFRSQSDSRPRRIRERDDVVLHWVPPSIACPRGGQPLPSALRHLAACVPELDAVCAIDSALHRKLVTVADLTSGASQRVLTTVANCDGRSESGVESIFRLQASRAGYVFRTQAEVPGGRVDFLFGDRLVVEVDGSEFHSGRDAFVSDRERDAWHAALGFHVVRLTYAQVVYRWHEVEALLGLLHARGEHLGASRIRKSGRRADPGIYR